MGESVVRSGFLSLPFSMLLYEYVSVMGVPCVWPGHSLGGAAWVMFGQREIARVNAQRRFVRIFFIVFCFSI